MRDPETPALFPFPPNPPSFRLWRAPVAPYVRPENRGPDSGDLGPLAPLRIPQPPFFGRGGRETQTPGYGRRGSGPVLLFVWAMAGKSPPLPLTGSLTSTGGMKTTKAFLKGPSGKGGANEERGAGDVIQACPTLRGRKSKAVGAATARPKKLAGPGDSPAGRVRLKSLSPGLGLKLASKTCMVFRQGLDAAAAGREYGGNGFGPAV
jgi:hypothetical protein